MADGTRLRDINDRLTQLEDKMQQYTADSNKQIEVLTYQIDEIQHEGKQRYEAIQIEAARRHEIIQQELQEGTKRHQQLLDLFAATNPSGQFNNSNSAYSMPSTSNNPRRTGEGKGKGILPTPFKELKNSGSELEEPLKLLATQPLKHTPYRELGFPQFSEENSKAWLENSTVKDIDQKHQTNLQTVAHRKYEVDLKNSGSELEEPLKLLATQPPLLGPTRITPNAHTNTTKVGSTPEAAENTAHNSTEGIDDNFVATVTTNETKKRRELYYECREKYVTGHQCKNSSLHALQFPIKVDESETTNEVGDLEQEHPDYLQMEFLMLSGNNPQNWVRGKERCLELHQTSDKREVEITTVLRQQERSRDLKAQMLSPILSLAEACRVSAFFSESKRELGTTLERPHPCSLSLAYEQDKLRESNGEWDATLHIEERCKAPTDVMPKLRWCKHKDLSVPGAGFNFRGIISSCFEVHLAVYVELEEKTLMEHLDKLVQEETWETEEGSQTNILSSSMQVFLIIRRSLKRCSALTKNQTLFNLFEVFQRILNVYATRLYARLPKGGTGIVAAATGTDGQIRNSDREERMIYANIYKCKNIPETGAQQMLIDTQTVEKILLDIPTLGKQTALAASHSKFVSREMSKAEALLKVIYFLLIQNCLAEQPVKTQMISSGVLWGLGDIRAQAVPHHASANKKRPLPAAEAEADDVKDKEFKINWKRVGITSMFGFAFVGPVGHYWYEYLDRVIRYRFHLQPNAVKFVASKLTADGLIFGPLDLLIFFSYIGFASGRSIEQVREDVKRDFVPALIVGDGVWSIAQIVNFRFVPAKGSPREKRVLLEKITQPSAILEDKDGFKGEGM